MNYLTITEAEEYTGLSRNTILAWISDGKLEAHKVGPGTAPWLIPPHEVERVRQERVAELKAELRKIRKPVPNATAETSR